ncbi:uncharacterized protein LOC5502580 isoform X2 [Nematostella vectensis]|uniref:uncharacterized protein LOC5502580 isoform X2 n=1 Tax=Nematostella vectensis TaxID=45351 RepID=UPI00207759D0|nr:uncharacterized protein LOC5502580 isoform X2 [Nematostella vectensis]
MSQFRVQKVTKVRGLSELSSTKSPNSETKKPRSTSAANTTTAPTQTRQKKTSAGKPAAGKNPIDSKGSPTSEKSSRPATRGRPSTGRKPSAKSCPEQDKKQAPAASPKSKSAVEAPELPPRPSVASKPTTLLSQNPTSTTVKSKPEVKKESSYDASCSDNEQSSEQGSHEKLNPDGDFGYETGSYDDSDVSNSDPLSPSARDENKILLGDVQSNGYAYAGLEFRPLIVQDDIGIAGPIDTRRPSEQQQLDTVEQSQRHSYAYAGAEFRPLIIGDDGGVAAPVDTKKPTTMTAYEEVEIVGGDFDRANPNMMQLKSDGETSYADIIPDGKNPDDSSGPLGDVYAVVNKPKKSAPPSDSNNTDIPPRGVVRSASGSLYESITEELQDMIKACDAGEGQRKDSRSGAEGAAPPPLPRPYTGAGPKTPNGEGKPEAEVTNESEETSEMPIYAAVQKPKDKPKAKPKPKELDRPVSTNEPPPPLPNRQGLLNNTDSLGRENQSPGHVLDFPEKPKRPELGFLKLHRRKLSDGNIALSSENVSRLNYSTPSKKGHRRCRSQDDLKEIINIKHEIDISQDITANQLSSKNRTGSSQAIEAYLEVDVTTDVPITPKELKEADQPWESNEYELPDGWMEVESGTGSKYYWHVSSGTTQWERPQVAPRPKVLSFPVHSMGWVELEENQVAPHNMSETIADCISTLAKNRNDLWNTSETWGEGKDIRLLLEGDTLKLVEPRNKVTLLVQPVSKMRVWGVGKEDHRDFAYVARDPHTSKHKCHMFRCHGNISGRAITNALHEMCNKILEEKRRAQESVSKTAQPKPWSDIMNTPPPPSAKQHAGFNEKPLREQKKTFTAKFVGSTDVNKPTGMDMLNKAISKVWSRGGPKRTVLIEVTVSSIKITDCTSQEVIAEDRVRFLSFMGVGKDDSLCGYVMANGADSFVCHVFQCSPNAATLTKALREACQLRFQKCLDAHPEAAARIPAPDAEKSKDKDKGNFMSSVQGFLGKLGTRKIGGKKDESTQNGGPALLPKPTHTFMVKYYGALPVAVGTGIETVQEAAKHLTGGTLLICQLDVAINGVTLYDSQRSVLSRRHMDADTISYCGLTSNNSHFGLIQSQGGGKYICHVFSEYKTRAGPIVAAIQETM